MDQVTEPGSVRRRGPTLDRATTRVAIIDSARALYLEHGVRNTTMEMVAQHAGIVRQSLYDMVPGREELVRLAIMGRCTEIIEHKVRPALTESRSFSDGVVEVCALTIEFVRHDPELTNLFDATGKYKIAELLAGPHPAMQELVASVFQDDFARARRNGELRTDTDDDRINEWIRGVVLMILLRTDLRPDTEREMLRTFLVPALLHPRQWQREYEARNQHLEA
jgi:AcrR family transcriptional regulator